MRTTSVRILGSIAIACCIGACSSGGSDNPTGGSPGAAGNSQGAAGNSQGAAGNTQGAAGNTQGAAGNTQGAAGNTQGAAGNTTGVGGTTGMAGAAAGSSGAAGAAAGSSGAAGAAGGSTGMAGAGTGGAGAPIPSMGCNMPPATADSAKNFVQKIVNVTGVDPAFVTAYKINNGAQFSWTKRNFYVRLPANYDPSKTYPVDMEGTGCGGGETTGSNGEYALPITANQAEAIQIGLSYVTSSAANPSCIAFTDDYVNSPEVPYISAVVDAVEAAYCVDKNRVFMNGYSSGAFESVTVGLGNPDKVRAIGIQIGGGLRMKHVPIMNKPIAAMFVVGLLDQGNPIGPLATPANDTIGSVAARDELLKRNGCVDANTTITDTCSAAANTPCTAGVVNGDTYGSAPNAVWDPMYPKCHVYTGCPPKYPVVWCPLDVNHGNGPNPMGADGGMTVENYRRVGMWKFFSTLPEL